MTIAPWLTSDSPPSLILGVDPGLSGALAIIDPATPRIVDLIDMPTLKLRDRTQIDAYELASWIDGYAREIKFAVVEDVGAMTYVDATGNKRGQGAAASFAFGKAAGIVQGVIAANSIRAYFLKPAVWKSLMGLSQNKNDSREMAIQIFPTNEERFKRKMDNDRAEAVLLAVLGSERFK